MKQTQIAENASLFWSSLVTCILRIIQVHDFLRSILAFWEVDLHNVETEQEHVRGWQLWHFAALGSPKDGVSKMQS
jgi:hypothetical protein